MMLIEQTSVPTAVLPVAMFRDHLRLGTGFADDPVQDGILEQVLRASISAIEARTGKILISRDFLWSLTGWREVAYQALPVAPVQSIIGVKTFDRVGAETAVDPAKYALQKDTHRPRLVATGACLPAIPVGGLAEVSFVAGFGSDWNEMPADISQAVLLLANHYYEHRHEAEQNGGVMPFGVTSLIAPYRTVRILGGGSR